MANYNRADECVWGHPTPTAAHRTKQGFCKVCKRASDVRLRRRNRNRADTAKILEGLSPNDVIEILNDALHPVDCYGFEYNHRAKGKGRMEVRDDQILSIQYTGGAK